MNNEIDHIDNWSLPEVMAWILFRDEKMVERALEHKLSVMEILNAQLINTDTNQYDITDAIQERDILVSRLESNKLQAYGIGPNANRPQLIPPSEWKSVNSLHEFIDGIPAHAVGAWDNDRKNSVIIFRHVFIARGNIKRLWPEISAAKRVVKKHSDANVRRFLESEIEKRNGYISQKEGQIIVQAKFEGYSRDKIRNLVKLLIGNDKRGPRGPRNN